MRGVGLLASALLNACAFRTCSAVCSYIKQCLGSPTPADYEAVVAERDGLQKQLEEANQMIAELQSKVRLTSQVVSLAAAVLGHAGHSATACALTPADDSWSMRGAHGNQGQWLRTTRSVPGPNEACVRRVGLVTLRAMSTAARNP